MLDAISNETLDYESSHIKKTSNPKNYLVLAGVEHVGGDMFESVPKGDAIFMKVSEYEYELLFIVYWIIRRTNKLFFKQKNVFFLSAELDTIE